MSKTPAKNEPAAQDAPPKKSKKLLIIIVILVLVLLLAVTGVLTLILLMKKKDGGSHESSSPSAEQPTAAAPPAASESRTVDLSKPPTFVTLEPFTVNLLPDEGNHYLQAIIALRIANTETAEKLKGFMPEIRHRINQLLSSKVPSDLSSISGKDQLAAEIVEQVNEVLGFPAPRDPQAKPVGPIQAALFNSFIIQ